MIVAGLMSGTSCDGIDVAVADLRFAGPCIHMRLLGDTVIALSGELQARLRQVMAGEAFPALAFCQLDSQIGQVFADAMLEACERIPGLVLRDIDLICSHGQTLWHWEEQGRTRGTLQMGNPAWIAERTGVAVISDLRMRDVAAGGNGAPLVGLVDAMLAAGLAPPTGTGSLPRSARAGASGTADQDANVGFLNLGGIANITVIESVAADPSTHVGGAPADEATAAVVAYDLGPANALIDLAMARYTQGRQHYDHDGRMAARGSVDEALLAELLNHPYYRLPIPRSTGKETFGPAYLDGVLSAVEKARLGEPPPDAEDVIATLTAHVARLVGEAVSRHRLVRLIISGGGTANPVLRQAIVAGSPRTQIIDIDDLGMPASAKEAYAFAVLGFLSAHNLSGTLPSCTGAHPGVVLGNLTPGRTGAPPPLRRPPPLAMGRVVPLQLTGN